MDSIESLRKMDDDELIALGNGQYGRDYRHGRIADEIEAEIAEKYMLLPVDADGVPIHLGSKVVCDDGITRTVLAVTDDGACLDTIEHYGRLRLHVVKPRTIEDVLASYRFDAQNIYEDPMLDGNQRVDELEALDGKVAAEIRDLIGVGE